MRFRKYGVALLAAAAVIVCALPATADNYPVRDGTGASQTFCSKLVGGLQYPCHLMFGMFGSTPKAVSVDGAGNVGVTVQSSTLPVGAATSSNQTAANAKLDTLVTNTTGAATAANQSTANTKLDSIVTNTTGAATAAGQATANTSLGSIDTKLSSQATTANQTSVQALAGADASKAISVQGLTGGKALPAAPGPTTSTTDRSITVTTGGTAQQVMAANTARRSFYAFNPNSSGVCWASFTTTTPTANGLGAFPIPSLGGFGMETSPTTAALYVNCPTTGQFITAWESQ